MEMSARSYCIPLAHYLRLILPPILLMLHYQSNQMALLHTILVSSCNPSFLSIYLQFKRLVPPRESSRTIRPSSSSLASHLQRKQRDKKIKLVFAVERQRDSTIFWKKSQETQGCDSPWRKISRFSCLFVVPSAAIVPAICCVSGKSNGPCQSQVASP